MIVEELYSQNFFSLLITNVPKKARVFVLGKPFQPSVMFAGKVRILPKKGVPDTFTGVTNSV